METVFNGRCTVAGHRQLCNAHFFYKGRSVIIDYEWCLHSYDVYDDFKKRTNDYVPFEVYPYGGDVYVGYVNANNSFNKADMSELISILDDIIEKEDKPAKHTKFSITRHNVIKLIAILIVGLWLGACVCTVIKCMSNINNKTCVVKNNNTRDYAYEHYCDSIYATNPDYYLDVLVETDKFQSYLNEHGKWWTE